MTKKLAKYDLKTKKFNYFVCDFKEEKNSVKINDILYKQDEKDPLNRFNGLFDGRTYGFGEFCLIEQDIVKVDNNSLNLSSDDVISDGKNLFFCSYLSKKFSNNEFSMMRQLTKLDGEKYNELQKKLPIGWILKGQENFMKFLENSATFNVVGNLHQNPNLFTL